MKEASPDFAQANFVLRESGPEFLLYSGLEALCFPLLAIGGAGFISVTANLVPAEIAHLDDAFTEGDWDEARDLRYRLLDPNDVVLTETNPTAVKWLMSQAGLIGRPACPAGAALVRRAAADAGGGLVPGAAGGGPMSDWEPVADRTADLLGSVSTATIASRLLSRGLRDQFITGVAPVAPGRRMVGAAWTARTIPSREDLDGLWPGSRPVPGLSLFDVIESTPAGGVLVIDGRGETRTTTGGDILVERLRARGAR
ncbi:hypothetical protein HNR02_005761 [Amycolatopsis endophytica]|uniref:Uncharacterized protein n=1 Tax=Amycolatopsis endophytica TaxID=860233 RepID=A0A853BD80_9PSEU|nr:hypothetical protein [Amycolatopsis endophytica]